MNESGHVTPRQPRGVLDQQAVKARFSSAELLIINPMAKAECRSVAAMVRILVQKGINSLGIEIIDLAPESIEAECAIEVKQAKIPQGDAK
ncbi:hypothetical protein [Iodobacter sp.]|jgi:hypothetical protein|uniref:hypothetical protein n=1 Tax=Iodobacter sp. TaxID=1915058 RepID=UPI0025EABA5B|nr:hypothetical protein [Iodobacter sp.]